MSAPVVSGSITAADVAALRSRVSRVMQELSAEVGAARALAERGKELTVRVTELLADRETAERVAGVLSKMADDRDAAAREQVESLVTAGLQAIFGEGGESLSFHLVQSTLRNAANVEFVVRTTLPDGESFDTDVLSARGGGLAAVVGLLLRVVLILLTRQSGQKISDVLVLDETLAHLSADRLEAAGAFLRTLVDSTGLQVIMVTHQPELEAFADVVHRLALNSSGVTTTKRISNPE